MKNTLVIIALLFSAFVFSNSTQAQEAQEAEIIAAVFKADWCGHCKQLGPKMKNVGPKLMGKAVKFVNFDFTDDAAKAKNANIAKENGLKKILKNNSGTGFIILVDAKTKKEVARVNATQSEEEILATFNKYL